MPPRNSGEAHVLGERALCLAGLAHMALLYPTFYYEKYQTQMLEELKE